MKRYAVEITDEALADMEQLYNYIAYDCLYLYEQGVKDCVALLKKLGVL